MDPKCVEAIIWVYMKRKEPVRLWEKDEEVHMIMLDKELLYDWSRSNVMFKLDRVQDFILVWGKFVD